jgi:dipeptidyl aminopeptidase/acylaminoacyl peptidase
VQRTYSKESAQDTFGDDVAKLRADSPAMHAADIKIPILLVHGALDTTSPSRQTREMAKALKKAHKDFKFVELEGANHQLARESDRIILLTELEQFLEKNLGTGAQSGAASY